MILNITKELEVRLERLCCLLAMEAEIFVVGLLEMAVNDYEEAIIETAKEENDNE